MKELPYLKFNASEWITGNITLEDFYTQGVFINICALYWFKSGQMETTEIKRRLKCKQATIDLLFANGHIKADGDNIKISFLDEQFEERGHISKINSKNGSKGGAPKGNNNAKNEEINKRPLNGIQPKTSNIEEEKNKNKNREEKRVETLPDFENCFDEIWKEQMQMVHKGKDLGRAIRESYAHLTSDPQRFATSEVSDYKKVVNSWLSKMSIQKLEATKKDWKL